MKLHSLWSWKPYVPPGTENEDIYVSRLVPEKDRVRAEFLCPEHKNGVKILLRAFDGEPFCAGETREDFCEISGLKPDTDYELRLECAGKNSRPRLFRTGERAGGGVTVNYLHPDDDYYAFSGHYLCSPSLIRAPQGHLLCSMDLFAPKAPQNLSLIFRSDDDGRSWHWVCDLFPCFWGRLFVHTGDVYMLACSTEYGDLLIGRSTDGGNTFSPPSVLWRGACHWAEKGVHKNPQPVICHNGRIWNSCEWGSWAKGGHDIMVFSAPEDSDLLDPASWEFTPPIPYDPNWPGAAQGKSGGLLEGSLTVLPDGRLVNLMRYEMANCEPSFGKIMYFEVTAPDKPLAYLGTIDFPGNHSKFVVKYDEPSRCYYSLVDRLRSHEHRLDRNLLSLMVSRDCINWSLAADVIDATDKDPKFTGFQYTDFIFDGDDLLYLTRAADNNAHSFHDANYSVFGKIERFRRYALK